MILLAIAFNAFLLFIFISLPHRSILDELNDCLRHGVFSMNRLKVKVFTSINGTYHRFFFWAYTLSREEFNGVEGRGAPLNTVLKNKPFFEAVQIGH